MVRPVYLPVTVDTGFSSQAYRLAASATAGQTARTIDLAGMVGIGMTVLTQVWQPDLEEIRVRRAMRVVTIGAVFAHRSMFPQKRAALL